MNQPHDPFEELAALAASALDEAMDSTGRSRLREMLRTSAEARRQYARMMVDQSMLYRELARGRQTIQLQRLSRSQLIATPRRGAVRGFLGAASLAAMVLVGVMLWLNGPAPEPTSITPAGAPVAVISGAGDVVWSGDPRVAGETLEPSSVSIAQGHIDLTFFGGASATLRGPAAMRIVDDASCALAQGRLDVDVSGSTRGFTVITPLFKVIDRGTRFSVIYSPREAQVVVEQGTVDFRPLAMLAPHVKPIRLTAGMAMEMTRLDTPTPQVMIRARIDLARIVETSYHSDDLPAAGLDMITGKPVAQPTAYVRGHANQFVTIDAPYIDGVVIPRGDAVPISSTGLILRGLGATSGTTYGHLHAGPAYETASTSLHEIDYAAAGHSLLGMHPNRAITFDLQAMRRDYPNLQVAQFTATAAMAQNAAGVADLLVAVDGEIRFRRMRLQAGDSAAVDVSLDESARFLTLIATDGGNDIGSDWPFFADPCVRMFTPATTYDQTHSPRDDSTNERSTP